MCEVRNFAACVDEIYGVRREIYSVRPEGGFCATRCRSKICNAKYDVEFCSAACRDKISGAITDGKFFGTALASAGNFELQNTRVNLRLRNTYADLKFKGGANFEPSGGINFKFKNGASFGLLCGSNVRSLKSNDRANALSSGGAMEILAIVSAGEILKYGVTAGISALALASKILIPSIAGKILNLSAASRTDIELKGAGVCRI
ncbi:hypothetical protein [uncultured Campylobacter sp.]|uniref:hypothetical protein n=1 Tax=uncultured Campylobacter sp. TaxID=218934 RepID=UPI002615CF90|nr:hypothetical protein [uncultured Campylobacter sp.]